MADKAANDRAGAVGLAVPLLLVFVLGAGAGFSYGVFLDAQPRVVAVEGSGSNGAAAHGNAAPLGVAATDVGSTGKADTDRLKEHMLPLDPILVNVGGGAGPWLRIEGSVAFGEVLKGDREALVAQLTEDVMSYMRSVSVVQLQTPAGLEFLKDDLSEIVQLRTKARARRFVLRTLVVE